MSLTRCLVAAALLSSSGTQLDAQTLVFAHANVITMRSDTILPDYTVIVRNGLIEQLGPAANLPVPRRARAR